MCARRFAFVALAAVFAVATAEVYDHRPPALQFSSVALPHPKILVLPSCLCCPFAGDQLV